jgi:hypothetical protein
MINIRLPRNNQFLDLIFNGKFRGLSPWCGGTRTELVHGGPRTEGAAVPQRRTTHGRWSSPVLAGDGGAGRASRGGARVVLTGEEGVATRRCTGGSERRRRELVARAKEGAKKLEREGMRCSEGRGVSSPFYRGRGAPERGGRGE